jgi:Fic family protein
MAHTFKSIEFMAAFWIWQQPDWPSFTWNAERLAPLLRECVQAQGRLMGMASSVGGSISAQSELRSAAAPRP